MATLRILIVFPCRRKKNRVNSQISPLISVPHINLVSSIPETVNCIPFSPFVK